MGLFDQVLGAINNPNQQGSSDQIGMILNTVQQLAGSRGLDPSATQAVVSVLGTHVRSALQQQRAAGGNQQAEAIVNQFGGTSPSLESVQSLFTPQQQQQVVQDTAQRTGINSSTIQALLPVLIPIVLNLLQSGASRQPSPAGSNSVLNSFLDSDRDGDVDLGDALAVAGRFLNQLR